MLVLQLWTFLMFIICPFCILLGILEILVTVCQQVYWDWLLKPESCVGDIQTFSAMYFESWAAGAIKFLAKSNRCSHFNSFRGRLFLNYEKQKSIFAQATFKWHETTKRSNTKLRPSIGELLSFSCHLVTKLLARTVSLF